MTDADWRACNNPDVMLEFLEGRVSDRKLRLFACACCFRIGHLLTDRLCQQAVEAALRFADREAGIEELTSAYAAAEHAKPLFTDGNWAAVSAAGPKAIQAASDAAAHAALSVAAMESRAAKAAAYAAVCTGAPEESRSSAWAHCDATAAEARAAEQALQAELLREIVGNPFDPPEPLAACAYTIVQLAEAMYAGEDCAFALHDALLEAGDERLAEHFRAPEHPRGCWAMDLILSKDR
ncbi:MAG: hypothetical protein K2R98_27525 [Gemmataceae bacterium]|nr:hypothetical protein [Gemmataceae bacterium]